MLDWFITIPGILISCGVVLLIIAVILFILGSNKNKSEKSQEKINNNEANNTNGVNEVVVAVQPEVAPLEQVPSVDTTIVSTVPFEEPVIIPESTPFTVNTVETSNQELPELETIYGDSISTTDIKEMPKEEPKPFIYGGNDPLEATQSIPVIEPTHEPYGGAFKEVKLVEVAEDNVVPVAKEEVPVTIIEEAQPAIVTVEEPVIIETPVTIEEKRVVEEI